MELHHAPPRRLLQGGRAIHDVAESLGIDASDANIDIEDESVIAWIHTYHSSNVEGLLYAPLSMVLMVAFRRKFDRPEQSERVYRYFNVTEELYDELFSSGSPGGTVWARLRRAGVAFERL